jgi:Gas vesicle protein K
MTRRKGSKTADRGTRGAARRTGSKLSAQRRKRAARTVPKVLGGTIEIQEIESLRAELKRLGADAHPPRWNANPDDVRRSVVKLVLTLVEFIRQLLERQAIRRVDAGTLNSDETEAIGLALMRLEETIRDLGAQFDIAPEDLNLDLGPVGRLM